MSGRSRVDDDMGWESGESEKPVSFETKFTIWSLIVIGILYFTFGNMTVIVVIGFGALVIFLVGVVELTKAIIGDIKTQK